MSKAIYCDHCENLISEEHSREVKIEIYRTKGSLTEEADLDLCKECLCQLDSWIFAKLNVEEPDEKKKNKKNR